MEKKVLIVHPKDESTHFLDRVYNPIPNKTVITGGVTQDELKELMRDHDRIMMMGHGVPQGLMSVRQFPTHNGLIIDHTFVNILKEKKESIFIWCNAHSFVEYYGLEGFYTGMFISENQEADYCGVRGYGVNDVYESNYLFVDTLGEHIMKPVNELHTKIVDVYGTLVETNPIARYNHKRLFIQ